MLHIIMWKLCELKVLKLSQNLHVNMEGFHRDSHIYVQYKSVICFISFQICDTYYGTRLWTQIIISVTGYYWLSVFFSSFYHV